MSDESPWWFGIAVAILQFLVSLRPWHLIVLGLVGVASCLAATRGSVAGIAAALPFGAVVVLGLTWQWHVHIAPKSFSIVVARTVDSPGSDDGVEWKFDAPFTIFRYSQQQDGELRIDGIEIAATNGSERPLQNVTGRMTPFARSGKRGDPVRMQLVVSGRILPFSEPQIVPAKSDFQFVYAISQTDGSVGEMPLARFAEIFGDLHFIFRYDTNQMFARLVTVAEMKENVGRLQKPEITR